MIVSLQTLAYQKTEQALKEILERGMQGIELVSGVNRREDRDFKNVGNFCRDYCVKAAFHLSPQWFAGDLNPIGRKYFERAATFFVKICGKYGISPFTVHCFNPLSAYFSEEAKRKSLEIMKGQVEKLSKLCEDFGIVLSLEVYPQFNRKIAKRAISPEEIAKTVKTLRNKGYKNVGITFDAEHVNSHFLNPLRFLKKYADLVTQVHLSDNDGKALHQHLPVGKGRLPLKECVKILEGRAYGGMLVIEVSKVEKILESYLGVLEILHAAKK